MLFLWVVVGYLTLLMGISIYKSRFVKGQDDFMVAGRAVPTYRLVGTLLCTWIGSGSLLAGAGLAVRVGLPSLWMAAGAWVGIVLVYFLAGKVRRIASFTVPDILEMRYNKWARILGTIVTIIAYTTIVGYQFRGGGIVLSLVTDIPEEYGVIITAAFIVVFTAFAGMLSIVAVDIINGAVITLAVVIAVPIVFVNVGGFEALAKDWDFSFAPFGDNNFIWAMGAFLPTFFLLLGESNMYQKFFSAKDEKAARTAVVWWVIGTVIVGTALASLAILAATHFQLDDPERIILHTARHSTEVGLPVWGGILLLCASVAIITSTGNSFLLTPSTNIARDVYQRFINPNPDPARIVLVQRVAVLVLGLLAYLALEQFETVLAMAYTAYTMVGAGITPALLAAFLWKRVTVAGGVASIATGMGLTLSITVANALMAEPLLSPSYISIPATTASIVVLVTVSLLTAPSPREKWERFHAE
jgi:solute:Na+ symporter, SSS family